MSATPQPIQQDTPLITERQAQASAWFRTLRDDICAAFESLEDALTGTFSDRPAGRFERTPWDREKAAAARCR